MGATETGTKRALVGGLVVGLDPPAVARADVVIDGGTIAAVGAAPEGIPRTDCTGCVLIPGLVVAHTHAYSALACGMPQPSRPPATFVEILERVWWRLDRALDLPGVEASARAGALAAARCGVTTLVDHHASPEAIDGSLDAVAAGLDAVGLRGALCYEVTDRNGRAGRDAGLRESARWARVARGRGHAALVGAHASFTLDDDTLDALRALADETGLGLHVHAAEDLADVAHARARGGLGAVLGRMGAARRGSVVAHAVHLPGDDVRALADAGAWVVTNARSNMNNAVGLARLGAAEGRVAMGTDGIGADLWAEAQAHFFRHQEERTGDAGRTLARLAAGWRLAGELFPDERFGALAPGYVADVAVLRYDPPTSLHEGNLLGHWVFGMSSALVRDVFVRGRRVVEGGVVVAVDERAEAARSRAEADRLWRRMAALPG